MFQPGQTVEHGSIRFTGGDRCERWLKTDSGGLKVQQGRAIGAGAGSSRPSKMEGNHAAVRIACTFLLKSLISNGF